MKQFIAGIPAMLVLAACTSTSSILIPERLPEGARLAIIPFEGEYADQTLGLIVQEFAKRDIAVLEGASVISIIGFDIDFSEGSPGTVSLLREYARRLDVDFVLTGSAEGIGGPLYLFDHVEMTMQLIDASTGQTRWIGSYGDPVWTSAISTKGDLTRGAKRLVKEFEESGAGDLVR